MRRTAMMVVTLVALGVFAGCAASVPEWVDKAAGAYPGDQGSVIYGVGVASADPNPQAERDMAKLNGREEIARVTKVYVAELTKHFVQTHKDSYNEESASSVQFYQQVAKQVTDATLYGSMQVNSWKDMNGQRGAKGGLYVLMMLPLNNKFFDEVQNKYKDALRQYQAQILKVQADQALKDLDAELAKVRQDPLGIEGMALPQAQPAK